MSIQVKCQLNPFSNEITEFETEAVSINKIIAKIDTTKAVNTGWRVLINDEIITDFKRKPKNGDSVYIKLVPEGDAKSAGTGAKVGGGLLVALGVVVGIATAWTGVGMFAGAALIGSGVSLFAGGVVLYNTKIPTPKTSQKAEQSPSIRGSKNQARPMKPIPILFGKRRVYADLASNPYTLIDGGEQYLYQLFCAGQKDMTIDINSFKLGETNIVEYSASKNINTILSGRDALVELRICSGETNPPFFTSCLHEDIINEQLKHSVTDEGLTGNIIRTTPDNTEGINVDIFFPSGLGYYDDDGVLLIAGVTVEAFYKLESEPDSAYKLIGFFNNGSNHMVGYSLKTLRFAVSKKNLPKGKYTVKVVRQTLDHDTDSKYIDGVYVGSIRAIKNEPSVSEERCRQLTLISLKVKATSKLHSYVEQLNFITQSKLPVYSNLGSGSQEWTKLADSSNPASAAIYAMQGELSQQKLNDSDIDWPAFERLYNWCKNKGYECNELVYDNITISDLLSSIASTCRAEILRINGKITVIQDVEKTGFVQMFTPRNSWDFQNKLIKASIPDALSVCFPDSESGYAEQELKVYNTPSGNKDKEPDVIQDLKLWGVTSNVQARKLAMYNYAVSNNRPYIYQFSCDFEYMLCSKGDWIKYAGDVALAGLAQGRIAELIEDDGLVVGFISDEELPVEEGKQYAVRIRKQDASFTILRIVNTGRTTKNVHFINSLDKDEIHEGDLFLFGYPESDSLDLIISDIQCKDELTADIIAVDYSPEIFGVDSPDFVLPEFENRISEISSSIDYGNLTLDEWQTFYTYSDSEEIPNRPTGNGTDESWHRQQTPNSIWYSVKTAKTIYDGEWSEPRKTNSAEISDLIAGTSGVSSPDKISDLKASADENGISITVGALGEGLKNNVKKILFQINKGDDIWYEYESAGYSFFYEFDRDKDGYPEYTDLQNWKVRAKAVNIYGKESLEYTESTVNTDSYGTWNVTEPIVNTRISDRTITLIFSQARQSNTRKVYGNIRYGVRIRCAAQGDAEGIFFKPNEQADPYQNELNYKVIGDTGYVISENVYIQTMPLKGQSSNDIVDTAYTFQIFSFNEKGQSTVKEVTATAVCTSIRDIVKANETAKVAYISSLSAITANLGIISQGSLSGNDNNYWALSTLVDERTGQKYYQGSMKVGGVDQFLKITPIVNAREEILSYEIEFKVGNFTVSSTASSINGELIIQEDSNSLDRTRITPLGTYYEHRDLISTELYAIAKQETRGLLSKSVYSHSSMIIGNADIEERRALYHDIGRPYISEDCVVYHFDTNLTDQKGRAPYKLSYIDYPELKGQEDNSPLSVIDFTPAILAVAPYSEIGKALYGQYSIEHDLGTSNLWTVDFWIQYIWAENQVLFRVGNETDSIYIVNYTGEVNYNEDSGVLYNTENAESDALCYNIALGAGTRIIHQGSSKSESINLEDEPFNMFFAPNSWLHFAIVLDENNISLWINDKKKDFERYEKASHASKAIFNESLNSFILDELAIDIKHKENFSDFVATSENKIPFGALDWKEKHMVLDYSGDLRTNLFDSELFKAAVLKVIEEKQENL